MNEVTRMNEAKEWARQLNTLDRDDAWRLLQVHARCRLGTRLERVRWRETSGAQAYFDRAPLAPASFVQRSVRMFAGMLSCADIGRTRADPGRNNRGIACRRAGARSAAAVWMEPLFSPARKCPLLEVIAQTPAGCSKEHLHLPYGWIR